VSKVGIKVAGLNVSLRLVQASNQSNQTMDTKDASTSDFSFFFFFCFFLTCAAFSYAHAFLITFFCLTSAAKAR
jgi:hypothetical protein